MDIFANTATSVRLERSAAMSFTFIIYLFLRNVCLLLKLIF